MLIGMEFNLFAQNEKKDHLPGLAPVHVSRYQRAHEKNQDSLA